MEDEKLVRRLQKGSRTALDQVISRYTAYVSTIVWRTLGAAATREDMEEAVSDVFLSLWSHVGELDPKATTVQELGLYMAGAKRMGKEGDRV